MIKNRINGLLLGASLVAALSACNSSRDPFVNRADRPEEVCNGTRQVAAPQDAFGDRQVYRYIVKRGDTLWGISKRFLANPWLWKSIWYNNPQVRNPHLIYPGDVLTIVNVNGEKRVTIGEAGAYRNGGAAPISFAGDAIAPFALKTQILTDSAIKSLPTVFGNAGDYLTLTQEQEVFAQTAELPAGVTEFDVYRPGEAIGEYKGNQLARRIGTQMDYIGKVGVIGQDVETANTKLKPIDAVKPILEGDLLLPASSDHLDTSIFFPKAPSGVCSRGYFIANLNKETMSIKEFDTVITSFGADNDAQVGDIWKIVRPGPKRVINGKSIQVPGKEIGYLMIIKVYEEFSIGFVLDSTQNIDITDHLVAP
ncbi:MAG: LysM peptidoglycan-binding domain-containing protein [Cardiobacteriaceae bacterium]|nr:LysM peptidoglycan-binding domain-containing protein [Cardiobacteriaceae bacterium]